jgi:hypothetical protein
MAARKWKDRLIGFVCGTLAVLGILVLTGMADTPRVGRYQISAWTRGQFVGAMIVDTVTGVVKYVDSTTENVPFEKLK